MPVAPPPTTSGTIEALVEALVSEMATKTKPAAIVRQGEDTVVTYHLDPLTLIVALRGNRLDLEFLLASNHLGGGVRELITEEGLLAVETPESSYPVDAVLQEEVYGAIYGDFQELLAQLQELPRREG